MAKKYTASELQSYVGRSFIIRKTRYGALDGKTGTVTEVRNDGMNDFLSVTIPDEVFSPALMLPDNFASEVN